LQPNPELYTLEEPIVHLRPSQIKIIYPSMSFDDPFFLALDILRIAHMKSYIRIGREMIVNLNANGVPQEIFGHLAHEQLKNVVDELLAWTDAESDDEMRSAMVRLMSAIDRIGFVKATRDAREQPGTARVRGLVLDDREEDDEEYDEDKEASFADDSGRRRERSTAWFADEISGCPSSLWEAVLVFISAGFTPKNNGVMAQKLYEIVKSTIDSKASKFRLQVPMSCSAFCVPGLPAL
jgi:RNA-dependent RNA polymerase